MPTIHAKMESAKVILEDTLVCVMQGTQANIVNLVRNNTTLMYFNSKSRGLNHAKEALILLQRKHLDDAVI